MMNPYQPSDVLLGINWQGDATIYPDSHGDVWACTWADDNEIYSMADDTFGIGKNTSSNLAIYKIEGFAPAHKVSLVNPMSDYGKVGGREGQDTWKGNGLICVDGVLYLAVSQHSGAGDYPDCVQRVYDASIVKSTDHGVTWSAKRVAGNAMFPGPRFATPFFVQFGKDYEGAMDDYIYAASCTSAWNNGNCMILGRVRRDRMPHLEAGDWEYFEGADGGNNPTWTPNVVRAGGIFKFRGHTSMTGIHYVPALNRFILPQWSYVDLDDYSCWKKTMLHLYEAPKPWGPWRHFFTEPEWGWAYYNPSLPAKWFEEGGKRMWMTMAGNFTQEKGWPFAYGFTTRKLELQIK